MKSLEELIQEEMERLKAHWIPSTKREAKEIIADVELGEKLAIAMGLAREEKTKDDFTSKDFKSQVEKHLNEYFGFNDAAAPEEKDLISETLFDVISGEKLEAALSDERPVVGEMSYSQAVEWVEKQKCDQDGFFTFDGTKAMKNKFLYFLKQKYQELYGDNN